MDGSPGAHARSVAAVCGELKVDARRGLTEKEAAVRESVVGPNALPTSVDEPLWRRVASQLRSPLVLTLIAAAIVATVVAAGSGGDGGIVARYGDALAIITIVLLNAILGVVQEGRAKAALGELKKLQVARARIRRDGEVVDVSSEHLVPGDIVLLEAGDAVPADARLVVCHSLATSEASLTGESTPVAKDASAEVPGDASIGDRSTMVFVGTLVTRGRAEAVVVATGSRTELGKIGALVGTAGREPTPLERRLAAFGRQVLVACLAVSAALFAWSFWRGQRSVPTLFLEAVSFAVAAIPEGLPAITTITLALGMQRMAKKRAIVRRLAAVETLGSATVICTDKTGTLTKNQMTVRRLWAAGRLFSVTGDGYRTGGTLVPDDVGAALPQDAVRCLATILVICNSSDLRDEGGPEATVVGDPTEGALLTLARKMGLDVQRTRASHTTEQEIPFEASRQRMSVVARTAGGLRSHVKGSAEVLLPRCVAWRSPLGSAPMTPQDRVELRSRVDEMSSAGLRVLVVADRVIESADADPESSLTLVGIVGMMDPPRTEVKEAVAACDRAGIRVVMITGDHPLTARAVAREVGLWKEGDEIVSGSDLARISDVDLSLQIGRVRVFARTSAEQKLRIVRAYKAAGEIVAMTGDGVNDAPALREADIGVAMGRNGTEVARQASDLVLTDDNFATLVDAVEEGRGIYRNIQKVVFFLLSSNAGLAVAVFGTSFFADWPPLTPLMILWINLVTNGLPALALGVDTPDPGMMKEPPRKLGSSLVGIRELAGLSYVGLVMGGAALALYGLPPVGAVRGDARTLAFRSSRCLL
jgi:P-type Ca2+ transporter type 2C